MTLIDSDAYNSVVLTFGTMLCLSAIAFVVWFSLTRMD